LVVTAISGHTCTTAGECTIATFYDQSGVNNCSGTCAFVQPTIANRYQFIPAGAGNGCPIAVQPCFQGTAHTQTYATAANTSFAQPVSFVAYQNETNGYVSAGQEPVGCVSQVKWYTYIDGDSAFGGNALSSSVIQTGWVPGVVTVNGASGAIFDVNNTVTTISSSAGTNACSGGYATFAPAALWQGEEFGVWAGVFTSAQASAMNLNMSNFWTAGGSTVCNYTGEGDLVLTGLTPHAWAGLRSFSSQVCGKPAINVCWPNGAGPEQCTDFSTSATTGQLVVTAISGHNCTSAGECTIKIFYDQIGTDCSGPCNWTQATVANRYAFLPSGSVGSGCPTAVTFINLSTTAGASPAQQAAWTAFICGGVIDGWWAKLDVMQLYASDTQAHALLNMISPFGFNGSLVSVADVCTFTTNAGFNCAQNGSTAYSYIDTGFAPASGTQFTQNAASIGAAIIEAGGAGTFYDGTSVIGGTTTGLAVQTNEFANFGGNSYFRVNESGGFNIANAGNTTGLWTSVRTSMSSVTGYRAATALGSAASSTAATVAAGDLILGASNGGSLSGGYDGLYQAFYAGTTLTGTDITNIRARLNTYLAAVYGSAPY
jgi:hypothetical protein